MQEVLNGGRRGKKEKVRKGKKREEMTHYPQRRDAEKALDFREILRALVGYVKNHLKSCEYNMAAAVFKAKHRLHTHKFYRSLCVLYLQMYTCDYRVICIRILQKCHSESLF